MKTYRGYRVQQLDMGGEPVTMRCVVKVEGAGLEYDLALRLDIRNHSPTGFEWGYRGSGPAQLALAILADLVGKKPAQRYYQHFKELVIARLPHDGWSLEEPKIHDCLKAIERGWQWSEG